jgi:benzoyl-CoA reductase/2-hydroxyglutaryl-CoA dehydratase subunit BcrC/BadD/HgdB
MPEAVFRACDAVPIYVGRFARAVTSDPLPRDACSLCRASLDLLVNHWLPAGLVDAIVIAGACDWTSRLGDLIDTDVPVWSIDVLRTKQPPMGRAQSVRSRAAALAAVLDEIGLLTDLPFTRRNFLKAYDREMEWNALARRLDLLRAKDGLDLPAVDYYRILGSRDLVEPEGWVESIRGMIDELPVDEARATIPPRVILGGSPTGFPDADLIEMIEESGLRIVSDDFAFHTHRRATPPPQRGGKRALVRWLADELAVGAAPPGGRSPETIAALVGQREARGIVWIVYRGCAVSAMEALPLERSNIPVLTVELDRISPVPEGLRTRLEAFADRLENLQEERQP